MAVKAQSYCRQGHREHNHGRAVDAAGCLYLAIFWWALQFLIFHAAKMYAEKYIYTLYLVSQFSYTIGQLDTKTTAFQ